MADEKDAYIAEHYGRMTTREIAEAIGINQSNVSRRAKKLGLSAPRKPRRDLRERGPARIEGPPAQLLDSPRDEWLKRMYELRDILLSELRDAEGSSVARIAKEYRELCVAIRREEEAGPHGDDGSGGLADIVALFGKAAGMPGADLEGGGAL